MGFQSLSFLLFLAVSVPACLLAGRKSLTAGKTCLLLASLVFYLWGLPEHHVLGGFLVLLGSAIVTWAAAADFRRCPKRRRLVLAVAMGWLLGSLLWHKFAAGWMPLGLSFFTFQQLWFLKKSYTGEWEEAPAPREWMLYTFFFPTVTSGPILRPDSFFPQLTGEGFLRPDERDVAAGLCAIVLGTAKKVLLADQLGLMVASGWTSAADLSVPAAWVTMAAYTLQLYLDFSGYCDIAMGCGRLLGLRLPPNFNSPYRSLSVGEFWKRWHITLTSFLRECLYFPLGGSRKGTVRTCLNIMVVFLVSGIWHGNGWTFVVWGLLHGLAQVMERLWGAKRDRLPKAVRWLLTMAFVNFAWVFFRAPDMTSAWALLSAAVGGGGGVGVSALSTGVFESEMNALTTILPALAGPMTRLLPAALLAVGTVVVLWPRNVTQKMEDFRPTVLSALVLAALALWAVLSFSGVTTFIYSNF